MRSRRLFSETVQGKFTTRELWILDTTTICSVYEKRDPLDMASPINSRCFQCEHFQTFALSEPVDENVVGAVFAYQCEAFPEAIPLDVYLWEKPHVFVFDDQVGDFVFQPDPARVEANPTAEQVAGN